MAKQDDHTLHVQQLFVRYHGQLRAFALALMPDFARADDVLQEVFLTVTSKAHEFERGSSFLAWSRAIVRLKLLESQHQSRRAFRTSDVLDSLMASCPEEWAGDEKLVSLAKCLGELAPKARELITLRYKFEHSPQEIARLLSRTVNSINVALSKARMALRECLDRQLSSEAQL